MTKGTISTNRQFLAPLVLGPYSGNKVVPRCHLPQKSTVRHLKKTGIEAKRNERKKRGEEPADSPRVPGTEYSKKSVPRAEKKT